MLRRRVGERPRTRRAPSALAVCLAILGSAVLPVPTPFVAVVAVVPMLAAPPPAEAATRPTTTRPTTTRPATTRTATTRRATTTRRGTTRRPAVVPSPWKVRRPTPPLTEVVEAAIFDIEKFWAQQYPLAYGRIPSGGLRFYPSNPQDLPPACGRQRITWEQIEDNALYCPASDYIAFDEVGLFPDLASRFGTIALGITLAHEVGHAMQARVGLTGPTVLIELQADCFAGAWLVRVARGESPTLRLAPEDLDNAILAMLAFRDRPGVAAERSGAHGNGFDRVNALQLGYELGVGRCADFETDPPEPTADSFIDVDDLINEGDADYPSTLRLASRTLNEYWLRELPGLVPIELTVQPDPASLIAFREACAGAVSIGDVAVACRADGLGRASVAIADPQGRRLWERVGDFGVATALAQAWATALDERTGSSIGRFPDAERYRACLAGAYAGAAHRRELDLTLSPGDLDQAVLWILGAPASTSPFDRVAAMRSGFLGGRRACLSAPAPKTAE